MKKSILCLIIGCAGWAIVMIIGPKLNPTYGEEIYNVAFVLGNMHFFYFTGKSAHLSQKEADKKPLCS